ncbi:YcaO-like family protein [Bacteroides sp. 519]|uniref:YcaO-like family protein n=1 Tax=Bacteroides sp. 519 TaxID=2302937 RepID=UPI0013D75959|nr:YcaO-like family protein [Bacteroides sp. 519]NDV57280.1 hypothetical protein [Bacteroides sp. 519]
MKKYKAATPEDTVNKIKMILSEAQIPIKDMICGDGDMFCSYRLAISENDDFSIGTNGKGMTPSYAQASAYAEMMERFQNRIIIYPNPANYNSKFVFFPDESRKTLQSEEAEQLIKRFTPRVLPKEGLDIDSFECIFVPFFHVNSKITEKIPYSLVRWVNGSNGMCAGNIPEEALIQGFNEIFERYCLQELYLKELTPPNIPKSVFEGTDILVNLERIKNEYGMDYQIKDCSLGEGYPVIGLLIYSPDRSKYIMHIGADLCPKVALERCFTETFQGCTARTFDFENNINSPDSLDLFNEFKRSLVYGTGRMPEAFFNEHPSYPYLEHSSINEGNDFKEDLSNIISWLINKGYDIYIRDNSFLKFPTYHICVPGLSDIDKKFSKINSKIKEMKVTESTINPLYRLPLLDEAELKTAIDLLENMEKDTIKLFPRNNNKNNNVNRLLILMLLYYKTEDDASTLRSLDQYIKQKEDKNQPVKKYYYAIKALLEGYPMPQTPDKEWLIARSFLQNRNEALTTTPLPTCFECNKCSIKEGCRYQFILNIEHKTQIAMANNSLKQSDLTHLLSKK